MNSTEIWPRPQINPLPEQTGQLENSRILLNGEDWKLNLNPPENFFNPEIDIETWDNVFVPSYITAGDVEYAYAKSLHIPSEWKGNKIFLRFDGANCLARVFVDGQYVRSHYGGFVSWDCDITPFVKPGECHRLMIGITNKPQEVNPFHKGGLMRDVTVYTVPNCHISRLHVETTFDSEYKDAILTISSAIEGGEGILDLSLTSPDGEELRLESLSFGDNQEATKAYFIASPLKWDSEHPHLYTLTATLLVGGGSLERVSSQIGFRQIERRGNEVFINNQLLKLRGINRHDIHPVNGRSLTYEQWEEDVRLFKQANINFIRTSHYPPSPIFLELCDRYGIYVENEIAVSFLGYGTWHSENDPAYTSCFMDQFAELIERDRSRPCVIIWSLANESYWGDNLAKMEAYAKHQDPSRLTIFSYPLTQHENDLQTDLWSNHYDRWDRNLDELTDCFRRSFYHGEARPVLHDESTHIPCYNRDEHRRDPGVRDFWGETIYRFWDRLWTAKGALGCAIWAGIDDIMLRDIHSFNYPWGILDGWRRPKPEYWHTRKGFSPIRLTAQPEAAGSNTVLRISNRFNHTNLEEVLVTWKLGSAEGSLLGPDVAPRCDGLLVVPAPYVPGATLELAFNDPFGHRVDEAVYTLGALTPQLPRLSGNAPEIVREEKYIRVVGNNFALSFSTLTGLITEGYAGDSLVVIGGPTLQLTGLALGPWELDSIEASHVDGAVQLVLNGRYDRVVVEFVISIDAEGFMVTNYTIKEIPFPSPREVSLSGGITSHSGGYDEVGVFYVVPKSLDTLSWERKGLWSVYPDWHIARLKGSTGRNNPDGTNAFHAEPEWEYRLDEKDWAAFGLYDIGRRGTRDFTSMKPHILLASLNDEESMFQALSDGSVSVRAEVVWNSNNVVQDTDDVIRYSGSWRKQDTRYLSMNSTETWSSKAGDYCELDFTGTGIAWVSSLEGICGMARVYIDGELKLDKLDLGVSEAGKTSRGYKKRYKQTVYAIEDLSFGDHTIRIEVLGERALGSNNSYVNIDHFIILDGNEMGDTRFILNNEFNYPELSWGDYTKPPILVNSGYTETVYTKLGR